MLLAEQREQLKRKEDAARELSAALFAFRGSAARLQRAAGTFAAIDGTGQEAMRRLLELTGTEKAVMFDMRHTHVRANPDETEEDRPSRADARPEASDSTGVMRPDDVGATEPHGDGGREGAQAAEDEREGPGEAQAWRQQ
jgi:hypothetical protein